MPIITGGQGADDIDTAIKAALERARGLIARGALAVIFTDADFRGSYTPLGVGNWNTAQMGIPNDSLSSVIVAPGYRVRLYADADWRGATREVFGELPFVGQEWNDRVSSLLVESVGGAPPPAGNPPPPLGATYRRTGEQIWGSDIYERGYKNLGEAWEVYGRMPGLLAAVKATPEPDLEDLRGKNIYVYQDGVSRIFAPYNIKYNQGKARRDAWYASFEVSGAAAPPPLPPPNIPQGLPAGRYQSDAQLMLAPYPPAPLYDGGGRLLNGADQQRWKELHPEGPPRDTGRYVPAPAPAGYSDTVTPELVLWYTYGYDFGAGFTPIQRQPTTMYQARWYQWGLDDARAGLPRRYGLGPQAQTGPAVLNVWYELYFLLFGLKAPYEGVFEGFEGGIGTVLRYGTRAKFTNNGRNGWGLGGPRGAIRDLSLEEYNGDLAAYGAPLWVGTRTIEGARLLAPSELKIRFGAEWATKLKPTFSR